MLGQFCLYLRSLQPCSRLKYVIGHVNRESFQFFKINTHRILLVPGRRHSSGDGGSSTKRNYFKKSDELEGILASCVSPENTSFDSSERVKHSIVRSGKDYIPLIEKKDFRVVDAVVYPNEDEIRRLLQSRNKLLEIVPFVAIHPPNVE